MPLPGIKANFYFFIGGLLCLAKPISAAEIHPLPKWRELTLELSPAIVVKAKLKATVGKEATPALLNRPKALTPSEDSPLYHLTVETRLKWFLSSKTWLGNLWLQPNMQALQRIRIKYGKKGSYKLYRYAQHGVYRIRKEPANKENAFEPPEKWLKGKESFYPFPPHAQQQCDIVTDPYSILLLISNDFPAKGQASASLCMFNKKNLYRVNFERAGTQPLQVDYVSKGSQKKHIKTTVQAEKILVRPAAFNPDDVIESFEFLGMEGDIILLRDPASHLLLQVEGTVPEFGRAKLRLTHIKPAQ